MKEATGELNVTVMVVTIVAVLSLLFFSVIWPQIKSNFRRNASCNEAICTCPERDPKTKNCIPPENGLVTCTVKGTGETIQCPWKG